MNSGPWNGRGAFHLVQVSCLMLSAIWIVNWPWESIRTRSGESSTGMRRARESLYSLRTPSQRMTGWISVLWWSLNCTTTDGKSSYSFKWLKHHLKIKKFWGTSENAVRIQIYSAITAYCMMAIVQKKMRIQRPIYEMLQLVSVSLTETLPLGELFDKPNNNIINELDDSSEPTLFNC